VSQYSSNDRIGNIWLRAHADQSFFASGAMFFSSFAFRSSVRESFALRVRSSLPLFRLFRYFSLLFSVHLSARAEHFLHFSRV